MQAYVARVAKAHGAGDNAMCGLTSLFQVTSLQTSISEASAELERISATIPEVDERVASVREDTVTLERQLSEGKNTYNRKTKELEEVQEESSNIISRVPLKPSYITYLQYFA